MLATCDGSLLLLHNLAFGNVSEMNSSILFVATSVSRRSSFLVSCLECPSSLRFNSFIIQPIFNFGFLWTTERLVMFCHPSVARLRLIFGFVDVLLLFGFSGLYMNLAALPEFGRLVWSVMDLMVLFFFCSCSWRLFLGDRQCWMVLFDLLQHQHQAIYSSFRVLKIQILRNSIRYFRSRIPMDDKISIHLFCHSLGSQGCCWGLWNFCLSMASWATLLGTKGWIWCQTDGAALLLRLLLRVG